MSEKGPNQEKNTHIKNKDIFYILGESLEEGGSRRPSRMTLKAFSEHTCWALAGVVWSIRAQAWGLAWTLLRSSQVILFQSYQVQSLYFIDEETKTQRFEVSQLFKVLQLVNARTYYCAFYYITHISANVTIASNPLTQLYK